MHFKVNLKKFQYFLDIIEKGLPVKTTHPVLNYIFIKAEKDTLTLTSTNLVLGIKCAVPAEIYSPGEALLPEKIIEIARHLPTEDMEIKIDENHKINIDGGNAKFNVAGLNSEEYPTISSLQQPEDSIYLKEKELKKVLQQTNFAVSRDEARPAFNGIYFKFNKEKGCLTLTASDTYRLIVKEIELKDWPFPREDFIIPAPNINELIKILTDKDDLVQIYPLEKQVIFELSSAPVYLLTNIIDEKFPDVSGILPSGFSTKVIIDTKAIKNALLRAQLLTEGTNQPVAFEVKGETLLISAVSSIGEINEEVQIESEGEPLQITFNCRFLLDFFKVIDNEQCILEFSGTNKPLIIKTHHQNTANYWYLVLPIKTT